MIGSRTPEESGSCRILLFSGASSTEPVKATTDFLLIMPAYIYCRCFYPNDNYNSVNRILVLKEERSRNKRAGSLTCKN